MKRHLFLILALLTTTLVNAAIVKYGKLYYSTYQLGSSYNARVTAVPEGGEAYSGDIVIPSTIMISGVFKTVTVRSIEANAFADMKELKSVTIPDNVSIGEGAFMNCSSLENVNLPKGLTYISAKAFMNTKLKAVALPATVTSIGEDAFRDSRNLTDINLPEGLTSISAQAFMNTGIEDITIPNTVTTIDKGAFKGCEFLKSITLSEGLTSIPDEAFMGAKFTNITLPATITSIGKSAFMNCEHLESVNLPEDLTSIEGNAFNNTRLKSVTLPSTLTSIGESAFLTFMASLKRITCTAMNVPTFGTNAFYCNNNVALYVNREMVNSFKNADGWKNFEYILPLTKKGDVNKDNNHNSADVVSIYNYIVEGEESGVSPLLADVNEDDAINASDVVTVYNYIIDGVPSDRILPIETLDATDITTTSATLNAWARLDSDADIISITVIDEKGEPNTITINKDEVDAEGNFCTRLEDLMPGTSYKYFASYNGSKGKWNGDTLSFAIKDIITLKMNPINPTSHYTMLYGSISAEGVTPTKYGFVYSTAKNPRIDTGAKAVTATVRADNTFYAGINNLAGETTYYCRAYILVDGIYYYTANDFTFTTKAQVLQLSASATPTAINAEIMGTMSIDGTAPTEYGLLYGKDKDLEIGKEGVISQKVILGALPSQPEDEFKCDISDLAQENTYYYRAYAIVDGKYIYGKDILSFVTKNVSTYFQLNTFGSDLNIICQEKYKTFRICYSLTNPEPTVSDCDTIAWGNTVPSRYYYKNVYCRAYILSGGEDHYSNIVLKENIGECPEADAVDLGLSVKWASWDLGATKPGECGDFFAWGETCPQYYKSYSPKSYSSPSKYSPVDGTLSPEADAAHVQWGGNWRMPSRDEIDELCDKCSREYMTDYNGTGINCMKVTGPNGNFILLPMAGFYDNELEKQKGLLYENTMCYFWGSRKELDKERAVGCTAYYSEDKGKSVVTDCWPELYTGLNIRPVCPK